MLTENSTSSHPAAPRLLYDLREASGELSIYAPPTARKKFLRLPQVKESTGLSRTAIYRKIAAREFPRPIHIRLRSVAWVEADVLGWMDKQEQLSRDSEQPG